MVHKYKVELEGSCQTPYMKDIPNMPVLAVVLTFGSALMRRYRGGVFLLVVVMETMKHMWLPSFIPMHGSL